MQLEPRSPAYGRVELSMVAEVTHANLLGNVHGGVIMRLVDSVAGAAAGRHAGGPAVTASMDGMAFLQPVYVGDLVRASAQVNWAGKTSMEIGVRVEAEPWNEGGIPARHVASAYLVFVAIDEHGRSRLVPPLMPSNEDEVRRYAEAEIRRAHRLAAKNEILASRGLD